MNLQLSSPQIRLLPLAPSIMLSGKGLQNPQAAQKSAYYLGGRLHYTCLIMSQ